MEAYAIEDQTSESIEVDNIVCLHRIRTELLLDRGPNILSGLIQEVCELLGMHKVNTMAYHPQCDGLVENFNKTLQTMLAKHAKEFGPIWLGHTLLLGSHHFTWFMAVIRVCKLKLHSQPPALSVKLMWKTIVQN